MKKLFQRMDQGSKEPSTGHTSYIGKVFLVGRHTVTVEDTIAEGGFALVFLAKASGGVRYALKRLCVNNEHDLQVARNEINILKSVNGVKTIVGLVDYQITASGSSGVHEVLMLMTYHKRPLLHLLNDRLTSGLTEAEVLKIFCDVCDAVARLHHSNPPVIHRDLKVENILCGADGGYVLCDFGSATCESVCPLQSGVPAVEEELGRYTTLAYRAPEMVDLYAGHTISTKADIWALGCLLYKLCFFTLPFGESPLAITSGSFTFPAEYPVKYSPALLAFIRYLLTPSPDTRPDIFQTAAVAARLGGVPSSVLANPNNSVVPTEEQLLALLREAPSSGGGNTAPSASRPPAAAGVRSSQHHMEVGGTSVAPRQRPKPQQHVTASSVGAVPPLPPLQPPPHTTPPPTLPGAPPKRAAPGRDESVAMHHHHYPQQHHHHQQQAQVLPEGKRASPSDAAALQQENSPVVSFPPSELFGSSFPEPARPTSHSPADADASPHDEEHAIPPDQNEAFFPPSGYPDPFSSEAQVEAPCGAGRSRCGSAEEPFVTTSPLTPTMQQQLLLQQHELQQQFQLQQELQAQHPQYQSTLQARQHQAVAGFEQLQICGPGPPVPRHSTDQFSPVPPERTTSLHRRNASEPCTSYERCAPTELSGRVGEVCSAGASARSTHQERRGEASVSPPHAAAAPEEAPWNPFNDSRPFSQLTEDHIFGAEFDKIRRKPHGHDNYDGGGAAGEKSPDDGAGWSHDATAEDDPFGAAPFYLQPTPGAGAATGDAAAAREAGGPQQGPQDSPHDAESLLLAASPPNLFQQQQQQAVPSSAAARAQPDQPRESTQPESGCLLEGYSAGQLVISPPPNFSSDSTSVFRPSVEAEGDAQHLGPSDQMSSCVGGAWRPPETGPLSSFPVDATVVGATSAGADSASVVQLVAVADDASTTDLQDEEAVSLPMFTKPPLEDRSKYEKFQNLQDESDEDKDQAAAEGPTPRLSRGAVQKLKSGKTVKATTKIGVDGKPESVFVCVSDDDSIGSASDLKARIDDECDDLGGASRSVGLGRGGEDVSETISSSVYHAECESVTTHEDDPRITGTTDPVINTRRGPKPSRASMRARANAKLEQEKRRASNPDRLLGHEYGEKPLLLDDELDDTGEEDEKATAEERSASSKSRALSLTVATDECASLINLQSPPPPVTDVRVPIPASAEAVGSPNTLETEVDDDVFALAPFKNPLHKLGNIFSGHKSISSHLQQVKQFPNLAVSATTNYSPLNVATPSPDGRTESIVTESERKQNLAHVIYEESPSEEFPIYENVTLNKTCPLPNSDDFEVIYPRPEPNSSLVRSAANNPFINPFYQEALVSTQGLSARGNSIACEAVVSSQSELNVGSCDVSAPTGKDIMSQSVDSLTFKQPVVSSTLSRVSSHSSTDLFGSTPFGCVKYQDKSQVLNNAAKPEFSSPIVENKHKSSGEASFSAQVTPKSKQNAYYVPSVENSPSYPSITSTPRNNKSSDLLENKGLEDDVDDEDLFGSVPFKPILGNGQRSYLSLKSRTLPANMSSSLQNQVQQLGKEEALNTHTEMFKSSSKSGKKMTPPTFRKPRLTHQILSSESESSTDSMGSSSSLAVGVSSKKSKNRDRSKDRLKYKNISEEFEEENTMVLPMKQFSLSKKDKQSKKSKKQDKPEKIDKKQEKLERKLEKAEKKSEKAEKKSEKAEKKLEKLEKKAEKADKKLEKSEKKNEKSDKKSEKTAKSEKKVDKSQSYEAAGISNMSFEDQSVDDYRGRGGVGPGPVFRNSPSSPDEDGADLRTSASNRFGSLKRGINPFSKLSNRI